MEENADALTALTRRMAALGATRPESWARSEISENFPQQARYLVLRRIWDEALASWRDPRNLRKYPHLARLIDEGADPGLLAAAIRGVVMETAFAVVMVMDEGYDPDAPDDAPNWFVAETDSEGNPTGRVVNGLHESLYEVDPTGREATDFE
jgi:hypothetical protein